MSLPDDRVAEKIDHSQPLASLWPYLQRCSRYRVCGDETEREILIADVKGAAAIAKQARKHKYTPVLGAATDSGRATTFGLKMALMYDEFGRALERFERPKKLWLQEIVRSCWNQCPFAPRVENLSPERCQHELPRKLCNGITAEFLSLVALIGASFELRGVVLHLQRTEVLEAEEPFTGQKGSSAMPQSGNPMRGTTHRAGAGAAKCCGGAGECSAMARARYILQ